VDDYHQRGFDEEIKRGRLRLMFQTALMFFD